MRIDYDTFHSTFRPSPEPLTYADVKHAEVRHVWTLLPKNNLATWCTDWVAVAGRLPTSTPRLVGYVVTDEPWAEFGDGAVFFTA